MEFQPTERKIPTLQAQSLRCQLWHKRDRPGQCGWVREPDREQRAPRFIRFRDGFANAVLVIPTGTCAQERSGQILDDNPPTFLTVDGAFQSLEEGRLVRDDQPSALMLGKNLDGTQRRRGWRTAAMHSPSAHDTNVGHNCFETTARMVDGLAWRSEATEIPPSDSEIPLTLDDLPAMPGNQPVAMRSRIGPGCKDLCRSGVISSFDNRSRVNNSPLHGSPSSLF